MKYKEFRKEAPILPFMSMELSNSLCYPMSPYISMFCIKRNIKPNTVTLLMIIMGIIGGIVLMIPNMWFKLLAFFVYYFWYVLDLSDGEVARITKCFSKGGKYLDWCAHLTCHPLFAVSMWLSLQQLGYTSIIYLYGTIILICAEFIDRNTYSMSILYGSIDNTPYHDWKRMSIIKYLYHVLVYFPNMVILFPLFLFLDIILYLNIFHLIYFCWCIFYGIVVFKSFFCFIYQMYKSE